MTLNFIKKLRWKQSDIKIGKGSKISSNTTIGYGTRINGKIMIKVKPSVLLENTVHWEQI